MNLGFVYNSVSTSWCFAILYIHQILQWCLEAGLISPSVFQSNFYLCQTVDVFLVGALARLLLSEYYIVYGIPLICVPLQGRGNNFLKVISM